MQDQLTEQQLDAVLPVLVALFLACVAAWAWIRGRWIRGKSVLPYEPRRQVPWRGVHVVLVVLISLVATDAIAWLDRTLFDTGAPVAANGEGSQPADADGADGTDETEQDRTAAHQLAVLVQAKPGPITWLIVALTAIIVAPIYEEFLFRLVLLGWLESVERRLRRRIAPLRRLLPGLVPIVLVSFVFAIMHFRRAKLPEDADVLMRTVFWTGIIGLVTLVVAVGVLRYHAGATAKDLGVVWEKVPRDVVVGLVAFAAVGFLVYLVQWTALELVPKQYAPDPIALFPFALVLGTLYWRTHRIVPSIVLHMALNAVAVVMLWRATTAGG